MADTAWEIAPFDPPRYSMLALNAEKRTAIDECVRNKKFNRFLDVLPNPETRVNLPTIGDDPTSHYINANYVRGHDGTFPAYIAAMGPLKTTISAFWRMIWNQKSGIILMVTGLEERGVDKCARYWPGKGQQIRYAGMKISWISEEERTGFVITTLRVEEVESGETHNVFHYWYNTWPDHGVPQTPDGSVFPNHVIGMLAASHKKQKKITSLGPPVVHCSAGIGRTGAIIAIDHCLRRLESDGSIDPCGVISAIREDRCAMVQHLNQYELVYEACVAYAEITYHALSVSADAVVEANFSSSQFRRESAKNTRETNGEPLIREKLEKVMQPEEEYNSSSEEDEDDNGNDLASLDKSPSSGGFYEPWYHGPLSREKAEELLLQQENCHEGSWFIRESTTTPGMFAVSLVYKNEVFHNRISYHEEMFVTAKGDKYETLLDLITDHRQERKGFQTLLKTPVESVARKSTLSGVPLSKKDMDALVASATDEDKLETESGISARKSGWLTKQGAGREGGGTWTLSAKHGGLFSRKNWKRRWFVLQDTIVKYYKKANGGQDTALGYINITAVSVVDVQTPRSFCIVTPKRTYYMYADDPQTSREWVDILQATIARIKRAVAKKNKRSKDKSSC